MMRSAPNVQQTLPRRQTAGPQRARSAKTCSGRNWPAQPAEGREGLFQRRRKGSTRASVASHATSSIDGSVGKATNAAQPNFGIACTRGTREDMEDELCCIPDFGDALYAAVFDGHGGNEVAKWLNENLQDFVAPALQQSGNYEAALQAAFQAADTEVLNVCRSKLLDGNVSGAGATATVAVVKPNEVITANLGDSSAVLQRNSRQISLTREHRVYGKSKAALAEKQRIKATGGWVSSDGRVCDVLAVSRAFGDAEFKGEGLKRLLADGVNARFWTQDFADAAHFTSDPVIATPAVTYTAVSEELGDEFIVMASDGLWDFWTIPSVMKCASDALTLGATESEVADILVEKAIKRHTSDNVAVIVVTFPWTRQLLEGKAEGAKNDKIRKRKGKFMGLF